LRAFATDRSPLELPPCEQPERGKGREKGRGKGVKGGGGVAGVSAYKLGISPTPIRFDESRV
jgi:hypothetical protein